MLFSIGLVQEIELALLVVLIPLGIEIEAVGIRCWRKLAAIGDAGGLLRT